MGLIKDQFGNVAEDSQDLEAIINALKEPASLGHLDFKGPGITRLG